MKQIIKPISTMVAMVAMLSFGSCSNEVEVMSFSPEKSNQQGVDFVAEFTPQQEAALIETGNPYGEVAQKDSWTSAISADIPTSWGVFELPEYTNTRAVGIYGSYTFSKNGKPTMLKKDGSTFYQNNVLSDLDRAWLNYFYLPYIARSDVYRELDDVVYDGNNNVLTEAQRLELQAALNNGNPTPPSGGRIPNVH